MMLIPMFESHNISYNYYKKALIAQNNLTALEVSERGMRAFQELLSQRLANEETANSSFV